MMAAAAAWDSLAAELGLAAGGYRLAISELTGAYWAGPAAASMVAAVTPYVAWLSATAGQAEQAGMQARAAAAAYELAFAMTVPPPVVVANRALLVAGGPVKPPAVPRAARRIRPSRCRPRKPADRGARPGRHRGAPDSNWAMRRRTAGLPPAAAAAASPAGSRRHGPAPHQAATSKGSVRCGSEPSVPLQCSAARAIWPIAAARFVDNVVAVDSAAGKITSWVGVNYSAQLASAG